MKGAAEPATSDLRRLLGTHGLRPDRKLSQNFLVDPAALDRVVAAAELSGEETVLEVGAGLGALTLRLAAAARRVVAIEVDRRLIPVLRDTLQGSANVSLLVADVLEVDLEEATQGEPFRVVANIPYAITSAVIRKLLTARRPPDRVVLTLQREVGERIVSLPGEMSLLALSVQAYGTARLAGAIPSGAFYPPPQVDSVILRIDLHAQPTVERRLLGALFRAAKAGFGQRRKQLRNALAAGLGAAPGQAQAWLEAAGVRPQARAQELGLEDWERLARVLVEERVLEAGPEAPG